MNRILRDVTDSALGRVHRDDPVLPRSGGPAGNAHFTALIGLCLLVLFLAELVTLLDVGRLISWHIVIGVVLIPPALGKTATTGWRILRYYAGARPYQQAGPPPLLLRLLGPLVVATTIAVLGSGLALIPLGPDSGRAVFGTVLGQQISPLTVHQASFILWAVATGLHVLARTMPALQLLMPSGADRRQVGGATVRGTVLILILALAAGTATVVLRLSSDWTSGGQGRFRHDDRAASAYASSRTEFHRPG